VVQYQLPSKYCTLSQRFGRSARDPRRTAKALLLIEAKYFDDEKQKVQDRITKALKTKAEKKRKAEDAKARAEGDIPDSKRQRNDAGVAEGDSNMAVDDSKPGVSLPTNSTNKPPAALSNSKARNNTKQDHEVEGVMDQFINAHQRRSTASPESDCRRKPGNHFFANPSNPEGMFLFGHIYKSSTY
jgi:hypothetical protein